MRTVLLIVVGVVVGLLVWGLIEPYFIDETAYSVALTNLPQSWAGGEIAVIADFQIGMWGDNLPTIRRMVDRIRQRGPALVVILGDFIYHGGEGADERIAQVVDLLRPLRQAQLTVVAILGNHDYGIGSYEDPQVNVARAENLAQALEAIGITVLENESLALSAPAGGDLYIVGVGSLMANRSKPAMALEGIAGNAARLVIMHNPTSYGDLPAGTAPLALAGHTHGGQFRLPFTPAWSWVTYFRQEEVHVDGWIDDYGAPGNRLYVNRGIGFSKVPLRLNCPPELTWLTLEKAQSAAR